MKTHTTHQHGFTIVELLIVIVVIGILAAITIVAYNGIQNRAYDTTVKSDLSKVGQQLEMYKADALAYPHGDSATLRQQLAEAKIKITTSAYQTAKSGSPVANFLYIDNENGSDFVITATSKSGTIFFYSSMSKTVSEYPNPSSARFPTGGTAVIRDYHFAPPANYGANAWGHGSSGWAPEWIIQ